MPAWTRRPPGGSRSLRPVGSWAGLVLLGRGLVDYRSTIRVGDTSTSTISGLAAGEARISGVIEVAEMTLVSLLQSAPCVYYRSTIAPGGEIVAGRVRLHRGARDRLPGSGRDGQHPGLPARRARRCPDPPRRGDRGDGRRAAGARDPHRQLDPVGRCRSRDRDRRAPPRARRGDRLSARRPPRRGAATALPGAPPRARRPGHPGGTGATLLRPGRPDRLRLRHRGGPARGGSRDRGRPRRPRVRRARSTLDPADGLGQRRGSPASGSAGR